MTEYEKAIQTAFREVADALAVQGTVDSQLSAQQALADAVEQAYGLSSERYERALTATLACSTRSARTSRPSRG